MRDEEWKSVFIRSIRVHPRFNIHIYLKKAQLF